jgi:hypothetical protein
MAGVSKKPPCRFQTGGQQFQAAFNVGKIHGLKSLVGESASIVLNPVPFPQPLHLKLESENSRH